MVQYINYRALRGAGMPAGRALQEARQLAGRGVAVATAWPVKKYNTTVFTWRTPNGVAVGEANNSR